MANITWLKKHKFESLHIFDSMVALIGASGVVLLNESKYCDSGWCSTRL